MKSTNTISLPSIWKNFFNLGVFQGAGMLLQILVVPVITSRYGLAVFGEVALSASLGVFLSNLVNYSTNQTSVKDITLNKNNSAHLSLVYSEVTAVRFIIFLLIVIFFSLILFTWDLILLPLNFLSFSSFDFFLIASLIPLIASEIFNPLFFLTAIEKIHWISWGNLITRGVSLVLIFILPLNESIAPKLNLILYLPLLIYYVLLSWIILRKFRLNISLPAIGTLKKILLDNFYVVFNNSSVVLQQSIFMFVVAGTASPQILGAYGIIDRLLSAVRQVVSAFSASIYPTATKLFDEGVNQWRSFRRTVQKGYFALFILGAILIFFLSDSLAVFFAGNSDPLTVIFFQCFSLAPLALALNANNVLDLLLQKAYKQMFSISLIILLATGLVSFTIPTLFGESSIGWYPLIIETACLLIYSIYPRTADLNASA